MQPLQRKILAEIIAAGGSLTIAVLEGIYERRGRNGDGYRVAYMNRHGWTEWMRSEKRPLGNAVGIRITELGRTMMAHNQAALDELYATSKHISRDDGTKTQSQPEPKSA